MYIYIYIYLKYLYTFSHTQPKLIVWHSQLLSSACIYTHKYIYPRTHICMYIYTCLNVHAVFHIFKPELIVWHSRRLSSVCIYTHTYIYPHTSTGIPIHVYSNIFLFQILLLNLSCLFGIVGGCQVCVNILTYISTHIINTDLYL